MSTTNGNGNEKPDGMEEIRGARRRLQAAEGALEVSKILAEGEAEKKKREEWAKSRKAAEALEFLAEEARAGRGGRLRDFIEQQGGGVPAEMAGPAMPEPIDIFRALTTEPAPLDFVLPGLLRGTVGALVSSGGLGKSWLLLQLAVQLAAGVDSLAIGGEWAQMKGGAVLYLPAEDPAEIIHHRLRALALAMRLTPDQCLEMGGRLTIYPMVGRGADLGEAGWRDLLALEAEGKRLVIFDTLRRYHKCDEKDGGAMGVILAAMESAALKTGAAHIFAHHANKAAVMSGKADEQQASRGASDLTDNSRWQSNLSGISEAEAKARCIREDRRKHFVKLDIPKKNYGAPSACILLERQEGGWLRLAPAGTEKRPACKKGSAGWDPKAPTDLMPIGRAAA